MNSPILLFGKEILFPSRFVVFVRKNPLDTMRPVAIPQLIQRVRGDIGEPQPVAAALLPAAGMPVAFLPIE